MVQLVTKVSSINFKLQASLFFRIHLTVCLFYRVQKNANTLPDIYLTHKANSNYAVLSISCLNLERTYSCGDNMEFPIVQIIRDTGLF